MQCPYCSADSQVVDSRTTQEGVRRRRLCNGCKRRFTTYERVGAPSLKVVKRSGKSEGFDSQKLERTLARVGRNRPGIEPADIRRIARDIEARLLDEGAKSVPSTVIVKLALDRLIEIDKLAYDRLAANYVDEDGHLRIDGRTDGTDDPTQLGLFQQEPE